MADLKRQVLIHLHNSANTLSDPSKLEFGELALLHNNDSAATIYAKYLDGETEKLAEFGTKQYVQIKINEAQSDLEGKLNNLSGATMNLEDAVEEFSASTVAEFIRVDGAVESLSAGTIAEIGRVDGRIDNLSASTIAIETIANGALQSISHGTDGDYVTTTIGNEDENHDQKVGVAVKVVEITAATESNKGLAEASDVKSYVDTLSGNVVDYVKAVSGNIEDTINAIEGDFDDKIEELSGNVITYINTASGNIETTINALSAGTEAELANTLSSAKTYTDEKIAALDGSATIATVADDVVTLKAGIAEADGVISNNSDADITLAKVAKTGEAADVHVVSGGSLSSENVQDALEELQSDIDAMATGMIYKGALTGATQITESTDNKVGDTYTWTPQTTGTVFGKNVEQGDTVIVSAVNASGNATDGVVLERNVDGSVTAAASLTDDNIVLGNGDKTVKESNISVTDLTNAMASATTALQTVSTGTAHDYVTVSVSQKQNNNQNIEVELDMQSVATADNDNKGLAEASDVKSYVDTVSGNIESTINTVSGNIESTINTVSGNIESTINTVSGNIESTINAFSGAVVETYATSADTVAYIKEVSGNIESTIEAISEQFVESVTANEHQDEYVVIAVDNTNDQKPTLSATVQTAVVTSAMTASTEGILESDSLVNIKAYVDNKAETEANTAYENAVASANSYTDSALTEYLKDVKIAVDGDDGYNASAGVTATKDNATQEVKINFKDMIIDCGTY